jgi:two-component system sensor histidine kinase MprB
VSLRNRLTLVAGGAVAVVTVVISAVVFVAVAVSLRGEVDDGLRRQAQVVAAGPVPPPALRSRGGQPVVVQVVTDTGEVTHVPPEAPTLPLAAEATAVAARERRPFLTDVRLGDERLRMIVAPMAGGRAVQIAEPVARIDEALHRLAAVLVVVGSAGVVAAAAIGRGVAGAALSPLVRLADSARAVAMAPAEGRRVEVEGDGELAVLAASCNDLLAARDASLAAQRQLVADASHELRTPLTSLRTNVEVLARTPELVAHADVLEDVVAELDDLAALVSDLVDLARYDAGAPAGRAPTTGVQAAGEVRLDEVVEAVLARAHRRHPGLTVHADLRPVTVSGAPDRVQRAVANIVDNAVKWNAPGAGIEVSLAGGELIVRDHGPGIPASDLPFVFDRFYRGAGSGHVAGSGLGLAIVRQVAESFGGTVAAEAADGGGTRVRLRLPLIGEGPEAGR